MTARLFRAAYVAAHYQVDGLTFKLESQATGMQLFEGRPFALITAHNPRSEVLREAENVRRHKELVSLVTQLGLESCCAVGKSPDSSWQEESLAIFDLRLERALALGRRFEQNALLYGEADKVGLAWCASGQVDWFYPQILSESQL